MTVSLERLAGGGWRYSKSPVNTEMQERGLPSAQSHTKRSLAKALVIERAAQAIVACYLRKNDAGANEKWDQLRVLVNGGV